ncbi:MAG: hypothetical protein ACREON_02005 [Gemmatimonadaceae bacterium]
MMSLRASHAATMPPEPRVNATQPLFGQPPAWWGIRYPAIVLWHWTHSNVHDAYQAYKVVEFMLSKRITAGLLPGDHPWLTGISPSSGRSIWPENIVFASPVKTEWAGGVPDADEIIVSKIGRFLAAMVKRSALTPEIPQGPERRMPHAVNYLHGAIHFNGGYVVFNDFVDAMYHLSDRRFIREMKRFARTERRELTIVLRERAYDPEEYAWFVAFVRAHIPWYANGNGPTKKRVLWGTPSPYPAVNPINGAWIDDMERLRAGRTETLPRPAIERNAYFQERYRGHQRDFTFLERFHAWAINCVILAKGFQGALVFTRRKRIEPENLIKYRESEGAWRASYRVAHPFARIETVRRRRRPADLR